MEKLCVFCKHFTLSAAQEDWSEYTPGNDAEIYCQKRHWHFWMSWNVSEANFRRTILQAETCQDFELATEEETSGN